MGKFNNENTVNPSILISPFYILKNGNNKDELKGLFLNYYEFISDYLDDKNKAKIDDKINDLTMVQFLFKFKSNYRLSSNKIDFAYDVDSSDIFHQFMIAISSDCNKSCNIQGFKYNDLGCGISDYFEKYVGKTLFNFDYSKNDLFGIDVISFIANLYGFERLFNYYVSNDLKSLFYDLSLYSSIDDINKFIKNMDSISHINKNIVSAKDRVKAKKDIRSFLINLYSNKVLSSGIDYDIDEFESYMFKMLSVIPNLNFDDKEKLYDNKSNISDYILISSAYYEYYSKFNSIDKKKTKVI